MVISSADIAAWIAAFLLPLFRVGAFISTSPIVNTPGLPLRFRILLAVILTITIAPTVTVPASLDILSPQGVLAISRELLIGAAMGFTLRLIFAAFVFAGQVVGQSMGLGFASMVDPQNGVQVPVVSQFYHILAILVFLALDGHLMIVGALAQSFQLLAAGSGGLSATALWDIVQAGSWMIEWSVAIALPATLAMLLVNVAFGVMTRSAPQLNVFAVGFPITLLLGMLVMLISLQLLPSQVSLMTDQAFELIKNIVARR